MDLDKVFYNLAKSCEEGCKDLGANWCWGLISILILKFSSFLDSIGYWISLLL
jgi:hypothetical protein